MLATASFRAALVGHIGPLDVAALMRLAQVSRRRSPKAEQSGPRVVERKRGNEYRFVVPKTMPAEARHKVLAFIQSLLDGHAKGG